MKRPVEIVRFVTDDISGESRCPDPIDEHWLFRITSEQHGRQWYLNPSGPQFSIFDPSQLMDAYYSNHVEEVLAVIPGGTTQSSYQNLATKGAADGISRIVLAKYVQAIHSAMRPCEHLTGKEISKLLQMNEARFSVLNSRLRAICTITLDGLQEHLVEDYEKLGRIQCQLQGGA